MPPQEPPAPLSLAAKMEIARREELRLIGELTGNLVTQDRLQRAFDRDLIGEISVHHHESYTDDRGKFPLVSMSFVLRPPVSLMTPTSKGETDA